MAQITIYIPDDLAAQLRERARRAKKSLSAYISALAREAARPGEWPESFRDLCGSWEGDFPEIEDRPPEERTRW